MFDRIQKLRVSSHGSRATNRGLSLMEATMVIALVAVLTVLSLPAARSFFGSLATSGDGRCLISAALASARAIAAKEQRYAGIRFQQDLKGNQYIIFIVQDPALGAYFFRAVKGIEPVKLPDNIGVTDLTIVPAGQRNLANPAEPKEQYRLDEDVLTTAQKDQWLNEVWGLNDITTFSVIFSPAGKLVIHGVHVVNRDGITDYLSYPEVSFDDVFNKKAQVDARFNGADIYSLPEPGAGLFYQDDYWGDNTYLDFGLGPEPSRSCFVIYDKQQFEQARREGRAWSGYLYKLTDEMIFINPYTGTIINSR